MYQRCPHCDHFQLADDWCHSCRRALLPGGGPQPRKRTRILRRFKLRGGKLVEVGKVYRETR